jgi:hypothetical protein
MTYKLILSVIDGSLTAIRRMADGADIPIDIRNRDYQEYLEWVNAGNTAEDPDPLPEPETPRNFAVEMDLLNQSVETSDVNREAFKLHELYGLTQAQLEMYIENNVTTLAAAKTYLKKLSAVVLYLVKQTKLEQGGADG